jgi:hypothetical protein
VTVRAWRHRLFWFGCGYCPGAAWSNDEDFREERNRIRIDRLRRLIGFRPRLGEDFYRSMARKVGPFAARAFEDRLYHLTHDRP